MYATVRRYESAGPLADAIASHSGEVNELISGIDGFVSYHVSRDGDMVTSITICNDKAGCDESTRRAADWVKKNVSQLPGPPQVSGGTVFLEFSK